MSFTILAENEGWKGELGSMKIYLEMRNEIPTKEKKGRSKELKESKNCYFHLEQGIMLMSRAVKHLNPIFLDSELYVSGYKLFREDRAKGVVLQLRSTFNHN